MGNGTGMMVLSDGSGSWLLDEDDEIFSLYEENGWEWDADGTSCQKCGDSELFDDVDVTGDVNGDCEVRISYLVHRGGGRYERVNYCGSFSERELVGLWEVVE